MPDIALHLLRAPLLVALWFAACAPAPPTANMFGTPVPVAIEGYTGNAMEPFLSRNGATLFFNDRNDPGDQTDFHWATRLSATRFRYRGRVAGANSPALDGVASMSAAGRLCFISTRAYDQTLATLFCGDWRGGGVHTVTLQRRATPRIRGQVIFDAELAADGRTAVLSQGTFTGGPAPERAVLRLARRVGDALVLSPANDRLFAALNGDGLTYAAALSADGLAMAYTHPTGWGPFAHPAIWIARRRSPDAPFGQPLRIAAIEGFAEAPTFTPDGRTILYHRREGDHARLWSITLPARDRPRV